MLSTLRTLPIESVADRLGLKITHHKTLCPYHNDSTPSLSFHTRSNTFRCFACGAHGDAIALTMQVLGKSFTEACKWLANEHNIITTQYHPTPKPQKRYPPDTEYLSSLVARPYLNEPARHFLFDQRRLDPRVIEWCGISSISSPTPCWRYGKPFYDAPSLLFPYRDINGQVLNVQSRYLGPPPLRGSGERVARFRFPSNSSIHIFNLPILRLLKPHEPLFISEGITDCLALMSAGHKAIAIPSATLLKPQDIQILKDLPLSRGTEGVSFHIYPDQDAPGEQLYNQLSSLLPNLTRHQLPPGIKDFSDYYLQRKR